MAHEEYADQDMRLKTAILRADPAKVASILQSGVNVNAKDGNGYAPLHYAAACGSAEVAALLLMAGADFAAEALWKRVLPIHFAASAGHAEMVTVLLEAGTDVNARIGWYRVGDAALHTAARRGSAEVAALSLNERARLFYAGETALHIAARHGSAEVVALLLQAGAEVDARRHSSPDFAGLWCSEKMNRSGIDAKRACRCGWTPLHLASSEGYAEVVRVLLTAGANATARTGDLDGLVVRAYVSANGPLDQAIAHDLQELRLRSESTALCIAAEAGHLEVVTILLEAGAALGASGVQRDEEYDRALRFAVQLGHAEVVTVLARSGADVNSGLANWKLLLIAVRKGQTEVAARLLRAGADVDAKDGDGLTALHHAASVGNAEMVAILLQSGADVNAKGPWSADWTPLHLAARWGKAGVVEVLLKAGADPYARMWSRTTPRNIASTPECRDLIQSAMLDTPRFVYALRRFTRALRKEFGFPAPSRARSHFQ